MDDNSVGNHAWQSTFANLEEAFLYMYEHGKFTDVKIIVKHRGSETVLQAHRLILQMRSAEMADLLRGSDVIVVKNVPPKGMQRILKYFYSNVLSLESLEDLLEFTLAVQKFKIHIPELKPRKFVQDYFKAEKINVIMYLEIAHLHEIKPVRERCLKLIQAMPTSDLLNSPEFLRTNFQTMKLIMNTINISTNRRYCYFEAIIRWFKYNDINDRDYLNECDLTELTPGEFAKLFESHADFFTDKEIFTILCHFIIPGLLKLPEWYKEAPATKNSTEFMQVLNFICGGSLKIETELNERFPICQFYGSGEFEGNFEIELLPTKYIPNSSNLRILELVFGTSFVPVTNLEVSIFTKSSCLFMHKKKLSFHILATDEHYYFVFDDKLQLQPNSPFVITVEIRAHGLRKWGISSPVSNGRYRVAQIPEDVFRNFRLCNDGKNIARLTPLRDWLLFLDTKSAKKCFLITSFYVECDSQDAS